MRASFISFILGLTISLVISSCGEEGCTDPTAKNYDSGARQDDGSCFYCNCTNTQAVNYYELATCSEPDSCKFQSDPFIGTYLGRARTEINNDSSSRDTITGYPLEVLADNLNPNLMRVIRNGSLYRMDTACGLIYITEPESIYRMNFTPDPNAPFNCSNYIPLQFDFRIVGNDSLVFFERSVSPDSLGTGMDTLELIFNGNRTN